MTGDITPWLNLVPGANRVQPNFISSLSATLQPLADLLVTEQSMVGLFDLDTAVGQQLDFLGQWIGAPRLVELPNNVYFSFDIAGLGFDQAPWWAPGDPLFTSISLPDAQYRTLLKARVVNNQWNGSIPNAYLIWDTLFAGTGYQVYIIDNGNMTMQLGLTASGTPPDALTLALFTGGYLDVKPVGVRISNYITP